MQPGYYYTPPNSPYRSGIPRVVGILAIIFAVIGIGGSAFWTWGCLHDIRLFDGRSKISGFIIDWVYIWAAASFVLFAVHLVGGILAIQYKQLGLRLLTGYAVGALVLIAIDLVVMIGFVKGSRWVESLTIPRTIFSALALPWPIVALALVNTRRAKEACS
jgi:hypothetical protein